MWIKNLTITNCRSLKRVNLNLSPDLNIFVGPNASGKTSVLESLNILSKGRSFRTSHIDEVISTGASSVLVAANVIDKPADVSESEISSQIGIEKNNKKTTIRIDKCDVFSQAELSAHLPITVIHPSSVDLITGSPALRRSYLDWIAFYIFPDFHSTWKKYQHILKQRNTCLKSHKHHYALDQWTNELIILQPDLIKFRTDVINLLQPIVTDISNHLLKGIDVSLEFNTGFPKDINLDTKSLTEFYASKLEYDLKVKRTTAGSHRADFKVLMNGIAAVESASRGQLKLLAICLLLAQSNSISNTQTGEGILLIDDLAAELDSTNKELLLTYLSKLNNQLIITSTSNMVFSDIQSKVFHVKHGLIS